MTDPCPRLIEVALPVREISAERVRDKSLRHGHVSTLHPWWARRPPPRLTAETLDAFGVKGPSPAARHAQPRMARRAGTTRCILQGNGYPAAPQGGSPTPQTKP